MKISIHGPFDTLKGNLKGFALLGIEYYQIGNKIEIIISLLNIRIRFQIKIK